MAVLVGALVGAVAIAIAWVLNATAPAFVTELVAAIDLAGLVLGFFGITISLGSIGKAAVSSDQGLAGVTTELVRSAGAVGIVSAGLLLAAGLT